VAIAPGGVRRCFRRICDTTGERYSGGAPVGGNAPEKPKRKPAAMKSRDIREQFLEFFRSKQHTIVPSSPVVPHDDPTLMFTNAGMNQFKDVFLGTGSRPYVRAADTQKCIRAGGKHNDLDDVGQDTYHHTFFEMLGNWSFGDYFKQEAIAWAWELLTDVWKIDPGRLHATYFEGDAGEGLAPDTEARDLWLKILPAERVHPGNKKDNFWEMGDTGPCGPCSEIHIDLTPDKSGGRLVNAGDARVMEIWNLVFIQFNRDAGGRLSPLPAKHVDTGMGFERICAVLTGMARGKVGQVSNYDTDVFAPIFAAIQQRTSAPQYTGLLPSKRNPSEPRTEARGQKKSDAPTDHQQLMVDITYRVIADHLRCLVFAITDGAIPDREGRGYVLRRILRRAVRYGWQYLNIHEPFLCDLVEPLVRHMGDAFAELRAAHNGKNLQHAVEVLRDEEESFGRTLERGIRLFEEAANDAVKCHNDRISGEAAFKLHDTYGFPIDLTELMAEERGLTINIGEYERLMEEARVRARTGSLVVTDELVDSVSVDAIRPECKSVVADCDDSQKYVTPFKCDAVIGYCIEDPDSQRIVIATDKTCFYTESGGQVSDRGTLRTDTGEAVVVAAVRKPLGIILHTGQLIRGEIREGQRCTVAVDIVSRHSITQNHTATHLLNWALRDQLGDGVQQKGSLVDPDKTRFDFSHNKPVTDDEIHRIEELVVRRIGDALPVYTKEVEQQSARRINTLRAVFGEKYPDVVRVVSIGADIDALRANPTDPNWMNYSVEFCGGTHVKNTAEIGHFAIVSEEGVAKGVRRIVGLSGDKARQAIAEGEKLLAEARELATAAARTADPAELQSRFSDLARRVTEAHIRVIQRRAIQAALAEVQKALKDQSRQAAAQSGDAVMQRAQALLAEARTIGGVTVVVGEVPAAGADALRGAVDWIRQKTESSAVLLATSADGKVTLIAGMSKDAVARGLKAGDLIKEIAPLVGGKGGGRPDMAQGGGADPEAVPQALEAAAAWISVRLTG